MHDIPLNERIIFALDFSTPQEARAWVERLDGQVRFFKVGLQLFLAGWWPIIDYITDRGNKVMVDLKFFDIPETVALAVAQLRDRHVTFATVHGNDPIIRAAVASRGDDLKILAVTVLTSFDETDMRAMGMQGRVEDLVLMRARKALDLHCDGVVASAREARALSGLDRNFIVVTPGIRPGANIDVIQNDDQKRVATARAAISDGADYVVIGRPISRAPDPLAAVAEIQREISEALSGRP